MDYDSRTLGEVWKKKQNELLSLKVELVQMSE